MPHTPAPNGHQAHAEHGEIRRGKVRGVRWIRVQHRFGGRRGYPNAVTASRLDAKGQNGTFWIGHIGGPLLIFSGVGLTWWTWLDWRAKRKATSPA
jgi:hypothetical protein